MRLGSYRVGQAVRATTALTENADFGGYRILLALAERAFDDGTVGVAGSSKTCVGQARIAKDARVHPNTVGNWLPRLVERGELIIAEKGGNGRGRWTVYQLPHVEKHTFEQRMPYESEDGSDALPQASDVLPQPYSTDSNLTPVDNIVDNLILMAQQIKELTQAIHLLTQASEVLPQANDVLPQAIATIDTSPSHTGGRTITKPTKPTKNQLEPLPPTTHEVIASPQEHSGGGSGDKGEVVTILKDFKVWSKTANELAALPHCTLDYVSRHIDQAQRDKINPRTLAWRLENAIDAPALAQDRNNIEYIPDEYRDIISR